ncbi:pyridoxamine 5'-phosphate oxidase family protein [Cupriavidus basilensis]|uniref:pyridoxamine 5'-phosphate oxidase family protein n=1 Tax=Cupriavidus TaxID=106589 RepID=UPI00045031B4|nr:MULTISPECIES: pyridoxamine 5'-phosphate oxidase family protein [Cupriavidus]KDP88878.1 pyridoxamine 5'-phosphate oxidase [Cupriavidus sp. SK-3]MDF3888928.1 pyridoxamine 5'-phosphate oxidase family protein [Cupriavidus basilensis]
MDLQGWPHAESPFHAGEQAAQQRAGSREKMEAAGRRVVRPAMPEQHRLFFAQLPFVVVGAVDAADMPWATVLSGAPGFMQAPDPGHLRIAARPLADDPLAHALGAGADIGLLGIELHTRRRNRMNGRIAAEDENGLTVAVEQSFGNCPRYIQLRHWREAGADESGTAAVWHGDALDTGAVEALRAADTIFIATHHHDAASGHSGGADVSHRGGKPGFVRVDGARTVTFPDFNGNNYFNTVGNLVANPRAGLLVPDFERGGLLHLSGHSEIVWEGPEVERFDGAERLVRLHVERVVRRSGVLPLRWQFEAMSPWVAQTGSWEAAAEH